ncbi:hypothetical protein [Brachybacterium sp. UMB0905]|uniref:hypothetical protein n=1 Tax=Brachybacterium sp. UMB0905 TaxID=2069310 RepID=UPI000C80E00F|nr:hypothetical protein [Brachybacterium sp. UMB0905]PMC75537.1 hypothetical protein CJ197_07245 [Brachybacterium sp. UMB0905]
MATKLDKARAELRTLTDTLPKWEQAVTDARRDLEASEDAPTELTDLDEHARDLATARAHGLTDHADRLQAAADATDETLDRALAAAREQQQ